MSQFAIFTVLNDRIVDTFGVDFHFCCGVPWNFIDKSKQSGRVVVVEREVVPR